MMKLMPRYGGMFALVPLDPDALVVNVCVWLLTVEVVSVEGPLPKLIAPPPENKVLFVE
jgi:hypothetical protein